ncbi:MAG: GPW/gp25 family protein [Pricia sp.]
MKDITDFLGQGWAFPPDFSWDRRGAKMVREKEDIEQSLLILFSTQLGERIMQHEYGCDLQSMVYEQFDMNVITFLKDTLETAIIYHEPRIKLLNINANDTLERDGSIRFDIEYLIRTTNTRTNLIYPFYMFEATQRFYK